MLDKSVFQKSSKPPITSDGWCGERFELDQLIANVDLIRAFCSENECNANAKFGSECDRMLQSVKFFHTVAPEFFFADLTENGIVTLMRIATAYTDQVVRQIRAKNRIHPHFRLLFKLFSACLDALPEIYEDLKREQKEDASNSRVSNCKLHVRRKAGLKNPHAYRLLSDANNDVFVVKFSTCFGFWLPDDVRKSLTLLYWMIAAGKKLPWSLSALFSSNSFDNYILDTYRNINLNYPFNVWHLFENPLVVNVINCLLNFWLPVRSETLHLPKQARFRLNYRGNILDFERMTEQEKDAYMSDELEQERHRSPGLRHRNHATIRCRYSYITSKAKILESRERIRKRMILTPKVLKYQTARKCPERSDEINNNLRVEDETHFVNSEDSKDFDPNPERKLVFYLHGGAFFTMGGQSSEMFLHKILNELGGINILAIDYSLTVPYPVPLQEILDVYLWLFSGMAEVKRMLGFHPKKIILAGDSCGAYFALALTIVLNELNKKLRNSSEVNGYAAAGYSAPAPVPLPISIVGGYSVLSFSKVFPSLILNGLDPLVEAHVVPIMVSVYGANAWCNGDFKRIEKSERFQRIVAKNKDQPVSENGHKTATDDDSTPWFRCDYGTYMNRAEYISSFYNHPFIEPLLYEDQFDELMHIDLYCFVGNNDCTLDCSIDLVRMWKGKACLDVFQGLTHAFLQLTSVSAEAREAFEIVIERFQEACGFL